MKIAFISTYDFAIPGGVKNHVCQLAHELTKQGDDTTIIAPSSLLTATQDIPQFIPIAHFPWTRFTGPIPPHYLLNPAVISRLNRLLKQSAFDLIHIHEPLLPPLCLSALHHKHTPLFATFHTYNEKGQPLYGLFRPIFNRWLQRLRGRITVSLPAKQYIEHYFPYDYRIIPNGVDIEKFSKKTPLSLLSPGYINLLFVGHAQFKRKGLRYLLDAFQRLKHQYPTLRLIIAGSKWPGRSKPSELCHNDIPDVIYLGTVSDEELVSLYQTADIFCAPSIGDESFGMVLTEAMAAGIPIVTTSINGYASVVRHEKEALLVPPKDALALANAIAQLIESPESRARLIMQSKLRVQRYLWNNIATDIKAYYLERLRM